MIWAASTSRRGSKMRNDDPAQFEQLLTSGVFDPTPGNEARAIQTELARMQCYTGGIDGKWGRGSIAAVDRYFTQIGTAALKRASRRCALPAAAAQRRCDLSGCADGDARHHPRHPRGNPDETAQHGHTINKHAGHYPNQARSHYDTKLWNAEHQPDAYPRRFPVARAHHAG